jgi:hypothetical protein
MPRKKPALTPPRPHSNPITALAPPISFATAKVATAKAAIVAAKEEVSTCTADLIAAKLAANTADAIWSRVNVAWSQATRHLSVEDANAALPDEYWKWMNASLAVSDCSWALDRAKRELDTLTQAAI